MIDFPNDSKKWDVVEQPSPKKQMTVARKSKNRQKVIEDRREQMIKDNKSKATGEKDE